jgi:hypothetical protein
MALPGITKTWEQRSNVVAGIKGGTEDTTQYQSYIDIKNILTDTIGHGFQVGTIAQFSGTTWEVSGITQFTAVGSMVGKTIKFRGQTTVDNDGDFLITAVPDSSTIRFTNNNASPLGEAVNGSYNVIGGNFTNPWVLDHTVRQPGTDHIGVAGDGIDSLVDWTDWLGDATNWSQFVVYNPVTGSYWGIYGDTSSNSFRERSVSAGLCAPHVIVAGGATNVAFTGPTVTNPEGSVNALRTFEGNSTSPWGTGVKTIKLHLWISDDGQHTRLIGCEDGSASLFWFDETVLNPHAQWATSPTTPVVSCQADQAGGICATYAQFNDTPHVLGTPIPTPSPEISDRNKPLFYLTAEGYGAAANGQNLTIPNELTGEWPMYPIGIASNEIASKGRLGQLVDIWWTSTGTVGGEMIPDDLSRQFVCIGDMILPNDGSILEFG